MATAPPLTPPAGSTTTAAVTPLSHHDALVLAAPFSRRGLRLDLTASDRAARQLVFRPVEHAAEGPDRPALQAQLTLASFGTGTCRLTRRITGPGGVQASLQAQGSDVTALLARVEAVDPWLHLRRGDGWAISRDYWLGAEAPVLTRGVVQVDGLTLTMTVSLVRGVAAELKLSPAPAPAPAPAPMLVPAPNQSQGQGSGPVAHASAAASAVPSLDGGNLAVPDDLLAVLGWDWARLVPERSGGWTTRLRLRGGAARRTRLAEAALERAAAHLALTLAEPPARFHERHRAARWGVVLRRSIPVLTPLALLATVLGMPKLDTSGGPGLWWLLYHVPTVLIAASFCLQELPRFEIPPLPRRSRRAGWLQPAAVAQAGSQASQSVTVVS